LNHPLCSATLKDGSACQSVAIEGGLCRPHLKKAAAAEVEAEGPVQTPDIGRAADSAVEEAPAEEAEPVRVESLRAALREGTSTAEVASLMQQMLLDGLRASKDVYATCRKCGTRSPVSLPDISARISSARALVAELDGVLKAETQTVDQRLEVAQRKAEQDLASCTDAELTMIMLAGSSEEEHPSMKDIASKLAEKLLGRRNADPASFVAKALSPDEAEFLTRVSSSSYWGQYPESMFELAERVLVEASATA
jgi:hypothetical protein